MSELPTYTDTRETIRLIEASITQQVRYPNSNVADINLVHFGNRKHAGHSKKVTSVRGRRYNLDITQNPFFLDYIAFGNRSASVTTGDIDPNRVEKRAGHLLGVTFNTWAIAPSYDMACSANERLAIINKVLAKAKGPNFASATQVGEALETIKAIIRGITAVRASKVAVARSLLDYKRLSVLKRVKKALKKTMTLSANVHLGIVFGYAPCAAAVDDLTKLLAKQLEAAYGVQSVYSGAEIANSSVESEETYYAQYDTFIWRYRKVVVDLRKVSATLRIRTHPERELSAWGGTWFDGFLAAWELTPYSFLVDWAVDIQSWLGAMRPSVHELLSLSTTFKSNQQIVYSLIHVIKQFEPGQGAFCELGGDLENNHWSRRDVVRRCVHDLTGPSTFPMLNPKMLKLGQWMILASLLALKISSQGVGISNRDMRHDFDVEGASRRAGGQIWRSIF